MKQQHYLKLLSFFFLFLMQHSFAQNQPPQMVFQLPPLLVSKNGESIATKQQWETIRRPEIKDMFELQMYGKVPGKLKISSVKILDVDNQALNGKAIRKQVRLTFVGNGKELGVEMLLYLPKGKKSFVTFLGYNFNGNHTTNSDTSIHLAKAWNGSSMQRGAESARWPIEAIIESGCGVATMYYWDIAPDRNDFSTGIYPLLYKQNQLQPANDEWGALAAWAWGLSRALDYLQTDKNMDAKKVIVIGHSRLGKAALWAGALDQRFAAVISNCSGCGGAAISRGKEGETIAKLNDRFPMWTCGNFKKYSDQESTLPFDQHMALAMVAPRPLYVASASEDLWADPKQEYLSAFYASEVYQLYGLKGIATPVFPKVEDPIFAPVSYHIRNGKHDILAYDWDKYIHFAHQFVQ
jgi:hypothetical protein